MNENFGWNVMLLVESAGKVAIIKLNHGTTNAINEELINNVLNKLSLFKEDSNIIGIVLTSSNEKFFSIGLNIPELFDLTQEEFTRFYTLFNKLCIALYTFPKPIIAAIRGHAIAGGCILALCCDYRFIASGRKLMGLNEIKLGVPVPYPGDCILQDLVGTQMAREVTYFGEFYEPEKLLQMGLVDQIIPADQLLEKSVEQVMTIGSYSFMAFQLIKQNRVSSVVKRVDENLKENQVNFIRNWYSDSTRIRLQEAMKKF